MDAIAYAGDILTTLACITIAIAACSGVVVALTGRSTDSFDPIERLNLPDAGGN